MTTPASNPEGVFGRMDAGVAGVNGRLIFKISLSSFLISAGSAVHVAIFDHGPANTTDNRARARQLPRHRGAMTGSAAPRTPASDRAKVAVRWWLSR